MGQIKNIKLHIVTDIKFINHTRSHTMPLIIICGYPSSGKTTICLKLRNYLCEVMKKNVVVVNENKITEEKKNEIYADSRLEKPVRGSLRGEVERSISRETVVILDGLNYIKSFRYELFCLIKAEKTLHCVVQCGHPREMCAKWNNDRPENERYAEDIFDGLVMRFEEPDSRNRWDSPLFTVTTEMDIDLEEVYKCLFERTAKPPNQSTQPTPLNSVNFMHDLDQITQAVITEVLRLQNMGACVGDTVAISGTSEKLVLLKQLSMAELRRIKRQFINYSKLHPVEDVVKLKSMFLQFMNTSIQG